MKDATQSRSEFSFVQIATLVALRIIVGWHLLYEGVAKLLIPAWTSAGYLESSNWILSGFFHWIATNPIALRSVDLLNIIGLTLIGLCLLFGYATRFAGIMGMLLLSLYYAAKPPLIGTDFGIPLEGHYLFVNKTLVEIFALFVVVVFPSGLSFGMDRILLNRKLQKQNASQTNQSSSDQRIDESWKIDKNRREILQYLATIPILGAFFYGTVRKYNWEKVNAITGATIQVSTTRLKDLKGELPKGKIGTKEISRLILGGNLIGGSSHSRDLIYVSSLFKAYNTEKKVFETLQLAEQAGINTLNIHVTQFPLISKYKRIFGSNLQTVCQIHPTKEDNYSHVDTAIDHGVDFIQIQGNCCDFRVRDNQIDVLAKCVEYGRKKGYPIGLGAHSVQALIECEKAGIESDFFMKTLHHDQYWSAHPRENRIPFSVDTKRSPNHNEFHDNMFCLFPEQTIDYFKNNKKPFMAFKILAGGAIHPKDGFKFAFENGADFICVGMFDYQIVDDINIALDVLNNLPKRERTWCA